MMIDCLTNGKLVGLIGKAGRLIIEASEELKAPKVVKLPDFLGELLFEVENP